MVACCLMLWAPHRTECLPPVSTYRKPEAHLLESVLVLSTVLRHVQWRRTVDSAHPLVAAVVKSLSWFAGGLRSLSVSPGRYEVVSICHLGIRYV